MVSYLWRRRCFFGRRERVSKAARARVRFSKRLLAIEGKHVVKLELMKYKYLRYMFTLCDAFLRALKRRVRLVVR